MNKPTTFASARQRLAERFGGIMAGIVRSCVRACQKAPESEREAIERLYHKLLAECRAEYHEVLMDLASAYAKHK